ncbi:D-2-hydroxyacid dehydrogenase family protein [Egibacter rhizosphaerae]|uniref:D-2-hydroxyacid dehydrogenase family protein n=1 Tax=Egibacter rhizosphaerae TaxID=1670831 RepID=A0A411YHC7_9ACTN|nr:D-2-hydroxyacid dehydrogenase family protein [Egibacter rhizosphaerae]QBI20521.1 D-2-hydroxyacid dehydrogenase family protein [Egibacter rhizosphaerae]
MARPRVAVLDDYEGVFAASEPVRRLAGRVDLDVFDAPLPAGREAEALTPYEIVVALRERTPFPAELITSLPRLEFVAQSGGHAYHADMEALSRHGIVMATGRPKLGGETAPQPSLMPELVFGLLFALEREIPTLDAAMRRGEWPRSLGRSVHGRTLGILGLGRHGSAVARAAAGFGLHVAAWGPTLTTERAEAAGVELVPDLDALLDRADIVSMHLKLSDESRGLLGEDRLRRIGPRGVLINTARGAIVDERALASLLRAGDLGGAALDVYAHEPLATDSPLRALDNVVLTPHVGWTTDRNLAEFAEDTVAHVEAYLDGRLPASGVANPAALEVSRDRHGTLTSG